MDKHIKPQEAAERVQRMLRECEEVINSDTRAPAVVLEMSLFEFKKVLQAVLFYLRA